ncbi:hypothetical protein CU098_009657, partial [Rhizopus stolonifer]
TKDYVPGPGEYEVGIDDANKHKRYGFLNQTNRFPEGTDSTDLLSEVSLSVSSIASDRKNFMSDIYRKEMEALLSKTRKMELVIQSLETEKKDVKAILINKDSELAELRSKNGILQKTINRQEITSKATQLQKKINQLQDTLTSTQLTHKQVLEEKEDMISTMRMALDNSATKIKQLEQAQHLSQQKHESLEAQMNTLSAHLSESQADATQKQMQLDQLGHHVSSLTKSNNLLEKQLVASEQQSKELQTQNQQLTLDIQEHQSTLSQLTSRIKLKEEEVDALLTTIDGKEQTIHEKSSLVEKLVQQFNIYREWVNHTMVPHLRQQRDMAGQDHKDELNRALNELHQAKKFMNKQALYLDELKSDIYWLTTQNKQLQTLIQSMHKEHMEQIQFHTSLFSGKLDELATKERQEQPTKQVRKRVVFRKKPKPQVEEDSDSSVSFTSRSSTSNDDHLDVPFLNNDSGFGVLTDETK